MAKVSNLQYGLSLKNTSEVDFKRGRYLKLKKWGGDEETNPKHTFKS